MPDRSRRVGREVAADTAGGAMGWAAGAGAKHACTFIGGVLAGPPGLVIGWGAGVVIGAVTRALINEIPVNEIPERRPAVAPQ
jgi:hypothetical protein